MCTVDDSGISPRHFGSTLCVCEELVSDVKDEKCCSVVFTHAAGSSISVNISHSASLTPSALLQYPHIFSVLSPPIPPPATRTSCSLTDQSSRPYHCCPTQCQRLPPSSLMPHHTHPVCCHLSSTPRFQSYCSAERYQLSLIHI